ncbi:AMP-binding protein [Taklimakanibacter lacteus]|uniref:AMP-binding protein n=1 Tax=Taklimakanibacter lacteus TaxID=2268456 RepID=UPI000E65F993
MNLLDPFLRKAASWGDRPAIIDPGSGTISFADLAARSDHMAASWRKAGLAAGDRVLIAVPFGIDLYIAIAALWRLGATIVFPEPALGLSGLRHAVEIAQPKAVLTAGPYRLLRYIVPAFWKVPLNLHYDETQRGSDVLHEATHDHPALISFTSGSTGRPKAIIRSHGFLAAQNAEMGAVLKAERDHETDLVCFPVLVIANLASGITSLLPSWKLSQHDKATAVQVATLIRDHQASRALIPPVLCETLARGGEMPGLRQVFTGGGPVYPDILQKLSDRHPRLDIVSIYGSTEAEPIAAQSLRNTQASDWQKMKTGQGLLAGRPGAGTRLVLLDDEITVTGPHVNKGYLGGQGDAENKITRDGEIWHRTGDAGLMDEDGRLWLKGRLKARAGRYFPFEVEAAARFWPGVRQAALIPERVPETLALAGDEAHAAQWKQKARDDFGIEIAVVNAIPLDRRHRSKVDYVELARRTARS